MGCQDQKPQLHQRRADKKLLVFIKSMEIETVIKIFQQTKAQDQMASQVNSTRKLEKS